jgi:hypothetical protein
MARSGPSATHQLQRFEAIASALEDGETFNLTEFAAILKMSVTNFRKTYLDLDPEFPFLKIGHGGEDYEIDGKAAMQHLADIQRARLVAEDGRAARIAALAGIAVAIGDGATLTIAEAKEIERIQDGQFKRRLAMNELVPAADHKIVVADLCQIVGDRLGAVATELDAAGLWEKAVRQQVIDWSKKLRIELYGKFNVYLEENEQGTVRDRAGVSAPLDGRVPRKRAGSRSAGNRAAAAA